MNEEIKRGSVRIPLRIVEPHVKPTGSILLVHGIFSEKTEDGRYDRLTDKLATQGLCSWRIDFVGHGDSVEPSERFTPSQSVADFLVTAQEFVARAPGPHYLIGSSFGGSVILLAAASNELQKFNFQRIAMLNPVTDYRDTFLEPSGSQMQELFTPERLRTIRDQGLVEIQPGFDLSLAAIIEFELLKPSLGFQKIAVRTLVLHGDNDQAVSHEIVRRDTAQCRNAMFITIPGAAHAFVGEPYESQSFDLIENFLLSDSGHGDTSS